MFKLERRLRGDYEGEEMLVNATWKEGKWEYIYEDIPYQVANHQITNQACIIGNGNSLLEFDLTYLKGHKGGMGGSKALQVYGCNALYRNFTPQFLIATGDAICAEIANSEYPADHIVYANSDKVQKYPGKFYLIPQNPPFNAGTLATYMACFDGHTKVYLLGFDNKSGENFNNTIYAGTNGYSDKNVNYSDEFFIRSMKQVFELYPEVEFVRVMPAASWWLPDSWAECSNFRQINFKQFGSEADL